jgi:predicted Ser/Thr protein kinase
MGCKHGEARRKERETLANAVITLIDFDEKF